MNRYLTLPRILNNLSYLLFWLIRNAIFVLWSNRISTSSSCRAASTDIPDPLSPRLPIIHRLWQVFRVTPPYHHIAAVCMFELVVLLLICHMWGSTGVHHLRSRPCFSSCVRHVWFVLASGMSGSSSVRHVWFI